MPILKKKQQPSISPDTEQNSKPSTTSMWDNQLFIGLNVIVHHLQTKNPGGETAVGRLVEVLENDGKETLVISDGHKLTHISTGNVDEMKVFNEDEEGINELMKNEEKKESNYGAIPAPKAERERSVRKYALERAEWLERENRCLLETIMKNEAAINVYREMADLLEIEEEKQ